MQNYEVSWGLLIWALPSKMIIYINTLLANIGTLVLILPLSFIIMSFIMPEYKLLRFGSSFFGTASTIYLIKSLFRNTTYETYQFGVLLLNKMLTLEEKKEIFLKELINITENYRYNLELFSTLSKLQLEKYFEFYNTKLTLLKEPGAIKLYAHEMIQNTIMSFQNAVAADQYDKYAYTKYALYTGVTIVLALIAFAIIRQFQDTNALIEGAMLQKDAAILSARTTENLSETQKIIQEVMVQTKELCFAMIKKATDMQNLEINKALTLIMERLTLLEKSN